MPDLSTLALFAVACLALTATPGPDMLLIASRSVSQGNRFSRVPQFLLGSVFAGLAIRLPLAERR
jgi:threonine/homoserine/homoserine lactone efflux protein